MQKGAAMSMKLLVVGIALTFVALRSDSKLNAPPPETRIPLAEPEVTTSATPPRRAYGKVGGRFEFLVAQSVSQSLMNSEESLRALEPYVAATSGETQMEANRLADEVASAIAKARQEMSRGRTYKAMDHAMEASNRIDDLRTKVFERR
jgi:hypothetical protein